MLETKRRFLLIVLMVLTIICFFAGVKCVALQMDYPTVSYAYPVTTIDAMPIVMVNIVGIVLLLLLVPCFFFGCQFVEKRFVIIGKD